MPFISKGSVVLPAVAAACALPLAMVLFVGVTGVNVPMYDEWIWAPFVLALHHGTLTAADIWAPQGAHRSLVPTLLALGLAQIDGWNVHIEMLVGVALVALTQLAVWRLLRRRLGDARRAAIPFLIASLLLFSMAQSENWLWGFQISWFLVNAGTVWTIEFLDAAEWPWLRLGGALLAALAASLSLIFGFGCWIAGAIVLIAHRSRAPLFVWCAAGVATAAAFLRGYTLPAFEHGWIAAAPSPLGNGAQFVLAYIGAPLGIAGARWGAEALGAVLLLAAGVLIVKAHRQHRNVAPWSALLAFALVAAAMEAAGRAGNGIDAALAFRYTTPASLAWIATIGLLAERAPQPQPLLQRPLAIVAGVLFAAANAVGAFEAVQLAGMQRAAAAAMSDLRAHDDEELAQYENDPAFLRSEAAGLRAAGLGPWSNRYSAEGNGSAELRGRSGVRARNETEGQLDVQPVE